MPTQWCICPLDRHLLSVQEFDERFAKAQLNLNEQGLNISLYWKNPDPRKFVNVVPTSAHTGEGIPDLLQLLVKLTQVQPFVDCSHHSLCPVRLFLLHLLDAFVTLSGDCSKYEILAIQHQPED